MRSVSRHLFLVWAFIHGLATLLRRTVEIITGPWTWHNLKWWAIVIGCVLFIRWCAIDFFRIPSASMEPTLQGSNDGLYSWVSSDRIAVNKFVYGVRFPWEGAHIPFTNKIIHYPRARLFYGAKPKRWDIVVFRTVETEYPGRILVKRVVGLPGERIEIKDGAIYVNGVLTEPPEELKTILNYSAATSEMATQNAMLELAARNAIPSILNPHNSGVVRLVEDLQRIQEKLQGRDPANLTKEERADVLQGTAKSSYHIVGLMLDMDLAAQDAFPKYGVLEGDAYRLVPEGHYYMLGDNSEASRDSRFFGWVPESNIMGRVFCIWWPPTRWRDFTGFSNTFMGMFWLYVVPALFLAYMLIFDFVFVIVRLRNSPSGPFRNGEVLWVNRICMGFPVPFSQIRLTRGRGLRPGAWVLFRKTGIFRDSSWLGQVVSTQSVSNSRPQKVLEQVTLKNCFPIENTPKDDDFTDKECQVLYKDLVGIVVARGLNFRSFEPREKFM